MKLYAENLREGEKIHFQNKRDHDLETLGGIHKKNVTLLGISLLENLYWRTIMKNLLFCHPKIKGDCTKKVATEKHRFAANKEA